MHHTYRGHDIVVLDETPKCAVIFEHMTGSELPTKVTALPGEIESYFLGRARDLIDVYLDGVEDGDATSPATEFALTLSRKAG